MIDRRGFLGVGAAALAASPLAAMRAFAQDQKEPDLSELYAAAKKDGELTWYVTHWSTETM